VGNGLNFNPTRLASAGIRNFNEEGWERILERKKENGWGK
jgi:hypothetical protein